MKSNKLAFLITEYFQQYIIGLRNLSKNTIESYRDTFTILLSYFSTKKHFKIENLQLKDFSRNVIENFLLYLENERHNKTSAIIQRLAAIKSFFRFIQVECPEEMMLCQSILNIEYRKPEKAIIKYLTVTELETLYKQPNINTIKGRRDLTILQTLYDTAARVQEICDLKVSDLRLESQPVIILHGKGNKARAVPIPQNTANSIIKYMEENNINKDVNYNNYLFFNSQKSKLSRAGITHILSKYISKANSNSNIKIDNITPHCLRHSKAMHMVEAGINLIYIRDFLGHESIQTTQVYAKANPEAKRLAIQKMDDYIKAPEMPDWNENPDIVNFLKKL